MSLILVGYFQPCGGVYKITSNPPPSDAQDLMTPATNVDETITFAVTAPVNTIIFYRESQTSLGE